MPLVAERGRRCWRGYVGAEAARERLEDEGKADKRDPLVNGWARGAGKGRCGV
jgi:hypothetical protein